MDVNDLTSAFILNTRVMIVWNVKQLGELAISNVTIVTIQCVKII